MNFVPSVIKSDTRIKGRKMSIGWTEPWKGRGVFFLSVRFVIILPSSCTWLGMRDTERKIGCWYVQSNSVNRTMVGNPTYPTSAVVCKVRSTRTFFFLHLFPICPKKWPPPPTSGNEWSYDIIESPSLIFLAKLRALLCISLSLLSLSLSLPPRNGCNFNVIFPPLSSIIESRV